MRHCRDCGRFTFNHNPRKGSKRCPDCKKPWSCDMCIEANIVKIRGQIVSTTTGERCYMCTKGYLEIEKLEADRKARKRK